MTTNRRVFHSPLGIGDALDRIESWLDQPNTEFLSPMTHYWAILSEFL